MNCISAAPRRKRNKLRTSPVASRAKRIALRAEISAKLSLRRRIHSAEHVMIFGAPIQPAEWGGTQKQLDELHICCTAKEEE